MIFKKLIVGPLDVNCYIIACADTKKAAVIDPGGDAHLILEELKQLKVSVEYVICTHGHGDHIGGADDIISVTGAKLMIHSLDADMLYDSKKNLSFYIGNSVIVKSECTTVEDGDVIQLGNMQLEMLNVPGHTPGSICIRIDDVVFTGDTLFAGAVGRTDFPGGNYQQLIHSIKNKLLTLPAHTRVFPGHGPDTFIEQEMHHNPFFNVLKKYNKY